MGETVSNFGERRRLLILWSGGLDSTLMVLEAARMLGGGSLDSVRVLSLDNYAFGDRQQWAEGRARSALRKRFRAEWKGVEFAEVRARKSHGFGLESGGCQQPIYQIMWASGFAKNGEAVCLGILRYADFWHGIDAFRQMATAAFEMAGKPDAGCIFPLEWWNKAAVIQELRRYRGTLSRVWYCETPKSKGESDLARCGRCPACFKQRRALEDLRKGALWGEYLE